MWLDYFVALLVGTIFLFLPGAVLLKGLRLRALDSVCCAPVVSIALYQVVATGASIAGVSSSWHLLAVAAMGISLIVCVASLLFFSRFSSAGIGSWVLTAQSGSTKKSWLLVLLYVSVSAVVTLYVFVSNLDGPESILQEYDNIHHLGTIQAFLESGDWSSFSVTTYAGVASSNSVPFSSGGAFYPAAFHCLAAMLVDAVGVSAALAENVLLALVPVLVFPLGVLSLLMRLKLDGYALVAGSCVVLAFGAYPWGMLMFGGIFPNLLSNALVPSLMAFFVGIFEKGATRGGRVAMSAAFLVACVGVALSQPNGIFTAAVLLAPFCVWRAGDLAKIVPSLSSRGRLVRLAFQVVALLLIIGFWLVLYKAPFLRSVVEYNWPAICTPTQALYNALSFSYTVYALAQPFLAIAVLLGVVRSLIETKYLWLTGAFAFASVIYVFCAGFEGTLKHVFAGFWYTDPFRVAATASLAGIPLAALGLAFGVDMLKTVVERTLGRISVAKAHVLSAFVAACFMVGVFFPNHSIGGYADVTTAFGNIRGLIAEERSATYANILDSDELRFAREAEELIPDDAVVVNLPDDGSAFLYGLDGLNLYYRSVGGYGGSSETGSSVLIREHLADAGSNSEVEAALEAAGIDYVLLLDQGGEREEGRRFLDSYNYDLWSGINSINDDTPGFEVVLAEGDMRLYRITALDE